MQTTQTQTSSQTLAARTINVIRQSLVDAEARHPGQLERVKELLSRLQAGEKIESGDPQHRPNFYFPFIKNRQWYDPADFAAVHILEESYQVIYDDLVQALEHQRGFEPYIRETARASDPFEGDMNVFFLRDSFTRDPGRLEQNRAMCPRTTSIVDSLPRAGEVALFSALNPHTHLPPHCGAENLRQTIHLALRIPEKCALRVGNEIREWRPGKCLMFDDSFNHEAWNRSERTRFVLLLDVWHPDLQEGEIRFFQRVGPLLNDSAGADASRLALDGKRWWVD